MTTEAAAYRERLTAPWSWWAVITALVLTLGLAVGYPLGVPAGVATVAVVEGVAAWLLVRWAAPVEVGAGTLVAGRARLPLTVLAGATPLDEEAARLLRGRDADARAYLLLRPWLPLAVRVDLDDPDDPTPYWYVATRRPRQLAAALGGNHDSAAPDAAG